MFVAAILEMSARPHATVTWRGERTCKKVVLEAGLNSARCCHRGDALAGIHVSAASKPTSPAESMRTYVISALESTNLTNIPISHPSAS